MGLYLLEIWWLTISPIPTHKRRRARGASEGESLLQSTRHPFILSLSRHFFPLAPSFILLSSAVSFYNP